MVKCSAILGDFFMKSDQIVLLDKRTNIRVVEVKSESEESEKIIGLLTETNTSFKTTPQNLFIFSLFSTLISKLCQLGET